MKLIVFSGLPGTGKSTLAESLGRQLDIPVFAKDWLEATLLHSGLASSEEDKPLGFAGYELLSVLAERQLMLNQSVILDSVASTQAIRDRWHQRNLRVRLLRTSIDPSQPREHRHGNRPRLDLPFTIYIAHS